VLRCGRWQGQRRVVVVALTIAVNQADLVTPANGGGNGVLGAPPPPPLLAGSPWSFLHYHLIFHANNNA